MKLLHSLLESFINEAAPATQNQINTVKSIISKYATPSVPYDDIIQRLAGLTNRFTKPSPDMAGDKIDVLPIIKELVSKGFLKAQTNGTYRRADAVSRVLGNAVNSVEDRAMKGDLSQKGDLKVSQTNALGHLAGDAPLGDKLKNAPQNYKHGGIYSGKTKEAVYKAIVDNDPNWNALSAESKDMVTKLNSLPNPLNSFVVLKRLLKARATKKGYIDIVKEIKGFSKSQDDMDAAMDLSDIGVIDVKNNTINNMAIKNIRNVIEFMKADTIENIEPINKMEAFLPKFLTAAKNIGAKRHVQQINPIIKKMHPQSPDASKAYVNLYNFIQSSLTDDELQRILSSEPTAPRDKVLRSLATNLRANSVDSLKTEIETKFSNYTDNRGEDNRQAKNSGRIEDFIQSFDI